MNTIQERWDSYRALVLNAQSPPAILREAKANFYAGASATMGLLMDVTDDDEPMATNSIDRLHTDLLSFANNYARDNA